MAAVDTSSCGGITSCNSSWHCIHARACGAYVFCVLCVRLKMVLLHRACCCCCCCCRCCSVPVAFAAASAQSWRCTPYVGLCSLLPQCQHRPNAKASGWARCCLRAIQAQRVVDQGSWPDPHLTIPVAYLIPRLTCCSTCYTLQACTSPAPSMLSCLAFFTLAASVYLLPFTAEEGLL